MVAHSLTSFGRFLFPLLIILLAGGCGTAPLIQDAGSRGPDLAAVSELAKAVEVDTGDGAVLRGAVIEPRPDGFLVLHLLPSRVSVATGLPTGFGRMGLDVMADHLAELGYGSLALDYRGVGNSSGARQTHRLLDDGWLMWHEALRRVNGDPSRIIIRAGSIGSLIVADLLERGESPAAVVLYSPIRAATIVQHAASARRGPLVAWYAKVALRAPRAPELIDVLSSTTVPTLVVIPERDIYLPEEEAADVRAAAVRGGHAVQVEMPSHQSLILRSWGFTIERDVDGDGRRGFSGRRTPELPAFERAFLDAVTGARKKVSDSGD